MSVLYPVLDDERSIRVRDARRRLYILLFGDRFGFTIFLGSLAFLALYWRVGVFITDNWTIANTMVAVADGHLYVDRIIYGPDPNTPGMHIVDGRLYGRNYGHAFAALPFVWLLEGLARVTDLRIAVGGLWSLVLLGFAVNLGEMLDRRRLGTVVGILVALGAFGSTVALATPLSTRWIHMMALQMATMVATALVGVVMYRLRARIADRRVGTFAGVAIVLATPLAFWASIPKRHAVTALLVALVMYSFYRSREDTTMETRYRALTYAWVGLLAWVHAPEALVIFVALVVVDLPTARSNDVRTLALVGSAFLLSLAPFFLTNQLIAGNPVEPPRLLPNYGGGEDAFLSESGGTGSGSGGGGSVTGISQLIPPAVLTLFWATIGKFTVFVSLFANGVDVVLNHPDRLYNTFIHSGYIEHVAAEDGQQAINIALLESMPLLAALLGVAGPIRSHLPDASARRRWLASPRGRTDLLVVVSTVLFTTIYVTRLPIHAMVTVRYLIPITPGLVYLMARLVPIQRALSYPRTLAWTYVAVVLVGGQFVLAYLAMVNPALGEAVQLHAILGLATAVPLGVWALHDSLRDQGYPRVGAVCLGLAAGVTTVFLLLSGIDYFSYAGDFALPVTQRLSDALSLVG